MKDCVLKKQKKTPKFQKSSKRKILKQGEKTEETKINNKSHKWRWLNLLNKGFWLRYEKICICWSSWHMSHVVWVGIIKCKDWMNFGDHLHQFPAHEKIFNRWSSNLYLNNFSELESWGSLLDNSYFCKKNKINLMVSIWNQLPCNINPKFLFVSSENDSVFSCK